MYSGKNSIFGGVNWQSLNSHRYRLLTLAIVRTGLTVFIHVGCLIWVLCIVTHSNENPAILPCHTDLNSRLCDPVLNYLAGKTSAQPTEPSPQPAGFLQHQLYSKFWDVFHKHLFCIIVQQATWLWYVCIFYYDWMQAKCKKIH